MSRTRRQRGLNPPHWAELRRAQEDSISVKDMQEICNVVAVWPTKTMTREEVMAKYPNALLLDGCPIVMDDTLDNVTNPPTLPP